MAEDRAKSRSATSANIFRPEFALTVHYDPVTLSVMGFGGSKIKVFVTKDQKKELKNAFRERADASGQVHKEFWVETAVEKGIVKELAEIIFNAFDKGGGKMDVETYLRMLAVVTSGTEAQRLSASFDLFDQNNDGFIDSDELIKVFEGCYKYDHSSENNGEITDNIRAELEEMSKLIFKLMDKDGSGKISREAFVSTVPSNADLSALLLKF